MTNQEVKILPQEAKRELAGLVKYLLDHNCHGIANYFADHNLRCSRVKKEEVIRERKKKLIEALNQFENLLLI